MLLQYFWWHGCDFLLSLSLFRGFHLSVIHNKPDILDKLLFIMSKDKRLKPVIDEQNRLYQVGDSFYVCLQVE